MNLKILIVFLACVVIGIIVSTLLDFEEKLFNPCLSYWNEFVDLAYLQQSGFKMEIVEKQKQKWVEIRSGDCIRSVDTWMPTDRIFDKEFFKLIAESKDFGK